MNLFIFVSHHQYVLLLFCRSRTFLCL